MRATHVLLMISVIGSLAGCNYEILKDNGRRSAKPTGQSPSGEKANPDALTFANVQARILEPSCVKCHGEGSDDGEFTTYAKVLAYVKPGNSGQSELVTRLKNLPGGDMPRGNNPAIAQSEVEFLKAWIDAGAPETEEIENPEPQPEPTPEATATPAPTPEPTATPIPLPVPTATPAATATPGAQPTATPAPLPFPTPAATITPTPAPAPMEATWKSINDRVIAPKCVMCHSGDEPKGDVDLTSYDAIAAAPGMLVKGDSSKSLLFTVIEDGDMPPPKAIKAGKVPAVTAEEREAIRSWIDGGGQN